MTVDLLTIACVALFGYLLGSVSFARVVTWLVNPAVNLDAARRHTAAPGQAGGTVSGIGASTATVALGKRYGGLVAVLDMLKAFLPTLALRLLLPEQPYHLVFSVFAILGHIYPIYHHFNGGRGLSPMLGSLLAIEPLGALASMLIATLVAILINQPQAPMLLWLPFLAIWSWQVMGSLPITVFTIILLALFTLAGLSEIRFAWQYYRRGRIAEYTETILHASPQARMTRRLSEKIRFWDKGKLFIMATQSKPSLDG